MINLNFQKHDEGTWRRVRNTEFASKFTYPDDINDDSVLDFPKTMI